MKTVALAGGVGGARLADGLAQTLPGDDLTVIVNTGDDFEHLGLSISPDLDTVCYTLAGLSNETTGWGRKEESWQALESIRELGGAAWFRLGDRDLGTHLVRTEKLRKGEPLSEVTREFCRRWSINCTILPMSDEPVRTIVHTADEGDLPFQTYFVARQCEPRVTGFTFQGCDEARPAPGVIEALESADLIVICPSNPWVSIDPILSIQGIRKLLAGKPVVAVSPIIGGKTVKGPAAKMFNELNIQPSNQAVAGHYRDFLKGLVIHTSDFEEAFLVEQWSIIINVTDTLMRDRQDRRRLAEQVLAFGRQLMDRRDRIA